MKASGRKILDWFDESLAHPHKISKDCLKIDENAKHLPKTIFDEFDGKKSLQSAKRPKLKYKVVIENKKYKYCMVIGIIGTIFVIGTISYLIWSQSNINIWFDLKPYVLIEKKLYIHTFKNKEWC